MPRQFEQKLLQEIEKTEKIPLYAGTKRHQFTEIWMVVTNGRVYVRSWKTRDEKSWYQELLRERIGAIILDGQQITVEARPIKQDEILYKVDEAYRDKYSENWLQYVEDMVSLKSRETTMEILSNPEHPRRNELRPIRE